MAGLRAAGRYQPQPVGALGPDPADPSRPAGHLEKRRDQPAVGQGRRCLLPLCQGRRAVELPQKATAEMADPLERFDVDRQPHGLQAHRRFPGAGRELGMVPGKDTAGWPSHPRAEPVRLHGRRNAGVPGRGRVRHPCGRQQGHGCLGAGERCRQRAGRPPLPLDRG